MTSMPTAANTASSRRRHARIDGQATQLPSVLSASELQVRIDQLVVATETSSVVLDTFLRLIAEITGGSHLIYLSSDSESPLAQYTSADRPWTTSEQDSLARWLGQSDDAPVRCERIEDGACMSAMSLILSRRPATNDRLVVAWHGTPSHLNVAVSHIQLIASGIARYWQHQTLQRSEWETKVAAAVAELQTNVVRSQTVVDAFRVVADDVCRFVNASMVAVAWLPKRRGCCRLRAVSGVKDFDTNGSHSQQLTDVIQAAIDAKQMISSDTETIAQLASEVGINGANDQQTDLRIVAAPLRTIDGKIVGGIVVAGNRDSIRLTETSRCIDCLTTGIADHLVAVPSTSMRFRRRLREHIFNAAVVKRCAGVAAVVALTSALILVRSPYRIAAMCLVEPTSRRVVVAPAAGILRETLVRSGDIVNAGDLLGQMDGDELRLEMNSIEAERSAAERQRDAALIEEDVTSAHLAQLEVERLTGNLGVLQDRYERQQITSPLTGIVLEAEIAEQINTPVQIGQLLYELAPVDAARVIAFVPENELAYVAIGQSVRLRLEGTEQRTLEGQITELDHTATQHDGRSTFRAVVELPSSTAPLRPGLVGHATVVGRTHSLGYNLFHWAWERAYAALRW